MKKLLIIVLLLSLFGCSESVEKETVNEQDLAQATVEKIVGGQYKEAYANFADSLQKAVSLSKLQSAYEEVSKNLTGVGTIKEVKEEAGNYLIICEFEPQDLLFTLSMDEGQVVGIWINYTNATIHLLENDFLQEQAVEVGKYSLDGILCEPKQPAKDKPVVLMIQGSGVSDYDETIGPNKPFKDLAHGLAKQGIASLRYNKRFFQDPSLAGASYDMHDEYFEDIQAAIALLKKWGYEEIYFLGHSQAGGFAHYIAAENDDIEGLIIMAGSPRLLIDLINDQVKASLQGMPASYITQTLKPYVDAKEEILAIEDKNETGMILNLPISYWYDVKKCLPENYDHDIDTLILQGEQDFQVYANVDYVLWQKLLKAEADYILYEGLNHLFMPSINGDLSDYEIASKVDQKVIDDISAWIKK
ncbi:MAG: alpha/beta hydrolase [Erysipelotrichaceae bacterium]|nr:alpha/beta hydrolase [Erysipelotrichaceae bacterium]